MRDDVLDGVRVVELSLYAFAPSAAYLPHQIDGAQTTPGRMVSSTRATAVNAPRSL